jgi:phosphate uptake regulator
MAQENTVQHTVHSYDEELKKLDETIDRMGDMAEVQLQSAIQALVRRDGEIARQVVEADMRIDDLEQQVSSQAVRLLAAVSRDCGIASLGGFGALSLNSRPTNV